MKSVKVLVIDDDSVTRSLLEKLLRMEKYETVSVGRISNCNIISLIDQESPHIIILDCHLGSEDTFKYVPIIREHYSNSSLPILMTSGIDRSQESLDVGADGFILKPFDWQDVTVRLNHIRDNLICQDA